jgi:uncharacterized protein (TIGR02145 family)
MNKSVLFLSGLLFLFSGIHAQNVTDYDGNVYDTVAIGTQVWLKQNLKVIHYTDGTAIPLVTDSTEWTNTITGSRCYYNNDSSAFDTVYGALYNGYVINDINKICPAGWHVSTNDEWLEAEIFLGGADEAGGRMKEAGFVHWTTPNTGADNSSGFTGLPGGMRNLLSVFSSLGENGLWWTASSFDASTYWSTYLWTMNAGVDHNPAPKNYGFSIRCVRGAESGLDDIDIAQKVNLYPNPATDKIIVGYSGKAELSIQLFTITGACIMECKLDRQSNEIDLARLSKGIYVVKIAAAGQTFQKRLIKL